MVKHRSTQCFFLIWPLIILAETYWTFTHEIKKPVEKKSEESRFELWCGHAGIRRTATWQRWNTSQKMFTKHHFKKKEHKKTGVHKNMFSFLKERIDRMFTKNIQKPLNKNVLKKWVFENITVQKNKCPKKSLNKTHHQPGLSVLGALMASSMRSTRAWRRQGVAKSAFANLGLFWLTKTYFDKQFYW